MVLIYVAFSQIKKRLTKEVTKAGKIPTTETVYSFLMERARANMHLILCMSPIGDAFRNRLRQYPGLINCTTIDWFLEWPREALLEVGNKFLMNLNLTLTITGENKVVGTPFPFPRDRFHSIRFLRSTRVSYHQSSTPSPPPLASPSCRPFRRIRLFSHLRFALLRPMIRPSAVFLLPVRRRLLGRLSRGPIRYS